MSHSPLWEKCLISPQASLRDALKAISDSGVLLACVVDESRHLLGLVCDSDVRRALLKGATLEAPAFDHCNPQPLVAEEGSSLDELRELALASLKHELPILNEHSQVVDIFMLGRHRHSQAHYPKSSSPESQEALPNTLFILAGGLGSRLRSAVPDRPKPLARVGGRPLIQTVILHAAQCGFNHFIVSLNYQAEAIQEHLRDPIYRSLQIETVVEPRKLGTAGSISLIKERVEGALAVCNADVLCPVDLGKMLRHHQEQQADVTVLARPFSVNVPFGVLELCSEHQIRNVKEKPKFQYLVNGGIYVFAPSVYLAIPPDQPLDMPDLMNQTLQQGRQIQPFIAHEYWIDVGNPDDYSSANREYEKVFQHLK